MVADFSLSLPDPVMRSNDCDVGVVPCAVVADEPGLDVISTR